MRKYYQSIRFLQKNEYFCGMDTEKKGRGGKRPGAGRKAGSKTSPDKLLPESSILCVRHKKEVIDAVRAKYSPREIARRGREWLEGLL
jgi:hypothetical protein